MPELKPITVVYPVMPAKDEAERAALRPIGRNRELYQNAIHGATDIVRPPTNWGSGASPRSSIISGRKATKSRRPRRDPGLLGGDHQAASMSA